jgi:hypothetical protein
MAALARGATHFRRACRCGHCRVAHAASVNFSRGCAGAFFASRAGLSSPDPPCTVGRQRRGVATAPAAAFRRVSRAGR